LVVTRPLGVTCSALARGAKQPNARAAIKNLKALGLRTVFTTLSPLCYAMNKTTPQIFFKQLLPATTVRQA
jgi:hypothetical protein